MPWQGANGKRVALHWLTWLQRDGESVGGGSTQCETRNGGKGAVRGQRRDFVRAQ